MRQWLTAPAEWVLSGGPIVVGSDFAIFAFARFIAAKVEQCCLCGSVFAQLCHLIDTAWLRFFLFSLVPAFRLFPLSLLPCLFFLPFCKCRSASWHAHPLK